MLSSTRMHRILKITAIAGFSLNVLAMVLLFLYGIVSDGVESWLPFWIVFSIGIPISGVLYETIKLREYLRDILGVLSKQT